MNLIILLNYYLSIISTSVWDWLSIDIIWHKNIIRHKMIIKNFSIIRVKIMNEFNISLFYLILMYHSPIELLQRKKRKRKDELLSLNIFFFDFDIIC